MMRVLYGCSDGNCVIRRPEGQHTNGGCQCMKSLRYQDGQKEFREGMALLHAVVEAARIMDKHQKDWHQLSTCCTGVTPTAAYLLEKALRALDNHQSSGTSPSKE